ncbi:MAG: peptide deformylase [Patescibacteria group bacterium]
MKPIVQRDNAILRQKAAEVPVSDITSAHIKDVIKDMKEALATQSDGIAIAAPQIGVSLRIFVISGSLLKQADPTYTGDDSDLIFINPVITKRSRIKKIVEEGCLSVRWLYGMTKRSAQVTLTAYTETGKPISRGASGLLAQIFQHEVDHLEGILFIDSAEEVWEMSADEIEELQKSA